MLNFYCIYIYICAYVHMCIHIHIYIYIYIYIYIQYIFLFLFSEQYIIFYIWRRVSEKEKGSEGKSKREEALKIKREGEFDTGVGAN